MTRFEKGFTLVEAVIVIVITGIVAAIVAVFMRLPVQGYLDSEARAELADAADTALRRMARDLRLALPNTVRVTTAGGKRYIEFLLTKTGGRYLAEEDSPTNTATEPPLSFTNAGQRLFYVVGVMPGGTQAIAQNDFVVVYNMGSGQHPADAYNCAGAPVTCNRALVSSVAGNIVTLASNPFATQSTVLPAGSRGMVSPGRHFHVVSSPITYVCDPAAGTLRRYWNYTIGTSQPTNLAAAPLSVATTALLVQGVTTCEFTYDNFAGSLVAQRSGLVGLSLTMSVPNANSGVVTLFHQIHVDNTP